MILNLKKNKKGAELGFRILILIIIAIASAVLILFFIVNSADTADEQTQLGLCRISNEIKVGLEKKLSLWQEAITPSPPRVCNTIQKTQKKLQVPSKQYIQDKKGAEEEIRDMIKNCWYMWLEGSELNMFKNFPGDQECFICYTFKIKEEDDIEGVTLLSIADSMNEPYFASVYGDNCDPPNGGLLEVGGCTEGRTEVSKKDGVPCCRKDIRFECENKGGVCADETELHDGYPRVYNRWVCPEPKQRCYVKEDQLYTYLDYVRRYGEHGGDIFFAYYEEDVSDDINYGLGQEYAITFFSAGKKCEGWLCSAVDFFNFINPFKHLLKLVLTHTPFVGHDIALVWEENTMIGFLEDTPNFMLVSKLDPNLEKTCRTE